MRVIIKWSVIGLLFMLMSCKAEWYAQKAMKKDPNVWKPRLTSIHVPPVNFQSSCYDIMKSGDLTIEIPRNWKTIEGKSKIDTVRLTIKTDLSGSDSLSIYNALNFEINCPDAQIEYVPIPTKPKLKDKLEFTFYGFFGTLALMFILITIRYFKRLWQK